MRDDDELSAGAQDVAPGAELLGDFATVEDYLRDQIEEFVQEPALWILDLVDMAAVRRRFEGGRWRYFEAGGQIFRAPITGRPDHVRRS